MAAWWGRVNGASLKGLMLSTAIGGLIRDGWVIGMVAPVVGWDIFVSNVFLRIAANLLWPSFGPSLGAVDNVP
jgi:hypothetical protein